MLKNWLDKLTDQYKKNADSNIAKIILVAESELEQVKQTFLKTEEWKDITKAEGQTLDLAGETIGQPRGQASDAIYRIMLRSREAEAQSDGTHDSILKVLAIALDISPTEIQMYSLKEQGDTEPAALIITRAPYTALNEVGMSPQQFVQLAQNSALAGVRIASVNFEGTFAFGTAGEANDPNAGFSNDAGTTGGFFGAVATPDENNELPI